MSDRSTDPEPVTAPGAGPAGAQAAPRPGWRRWLRILGPGLVTGASDDDPSGIATYSQAGAQYQFATLWTVIISLPLMMAVQEICDRTAITTGKSLGALARIRFARRFRIVLAVLLIALGVANLLNVAADLMAIGQGMDLLHAGPAWLWSAVAGVALTVLLITGSYRVVTKIFKWLCLSLLTYVAVLFVAHISWGELLRGLVGGQLHTDAGYWALIVAILGTTISPYLFFWQTAQRTQQLREEESLGGDNAPSLADRTPAGARREIADSRVDVFTGMLLSQVVMFAIIATTAATLGRSTGGKGISSAADAAKALEPIAGGLSTVLFALGFIGSGILAVPVLAGAASAGLAGLMGKTSGFDRSVRKAPLFYSLVFAGTIGGTLLSLWLTNPIQLLVLVALINGIAAAPFLVVVMVISSNRDIMGEHRNRRLSSILGWGTVVLMSVAGAVGIWQTIGG